MKPKFLKVKLNYLIAIIILLMTIAVFNYYLGMILQSADRKYHAILKLEKDFFDIQLDEKASLSDPLIYKNLKNKYSESQEIYADCHPLPAVNYLAERETIFIKLYRITKESSLLFEEIDEALVDLTAGVRYIHKHQIVYLKNLSNRGIVDQDYDTGATFERSSIKAAPEVDIIRAAAEIDAGLFEIIEFFNHLQRGNYHPGIDEEFSRRTKAFSSSVNIFEGYSLDAQDGLLVENLLINQKKLEKTFADLMDIEHHKGILLKKIAENRKSFLEFLNSVSRKIEGKNKKIVENIKFSQTVSLIFAAILAFWVVGFGKKVINETNKISGETEKIQQDLSYRIKIGDIVFNEFRIVFQALNSMAKKINNQMKELQRAHDGLEIRVREKTAEFAGANQELQKEIAERKQAEEALDLRLRYEKGLADSSRSLIGAVSVEKAFEETTRHLLRASDVCRVYIFNNFEDPDNGLCMRQIAENCVYDVNPEIDNPLLQCFPYKNGLGRWQEELSRDKPIHGLVESFPSGEQDLLKPQGILSILVLPVWVEGKWHGFIGFDDTKKRREWSREDIRLLRTAAEMIGGYTERKKAENSLAAEKERLIVTLRSIGDGVITTNAEGKIVLMNRAAEEMTGWTEEAATDKFLNEVLDIVDEESRKQCESPAEKVIKTGGIVGFTNHTILISRDGTEKNITDSGAPIYDKKNKIVGVIIVFQDVTERLRMGQELQKIEKLESLGILAGGIAHDFNNILTGIMGNISLAKRHIDSASQFYNNLSEAEVASLQAKNLTQQLLTFAKGGAPIKKTASITTLIKDAAVFALRGSNVRCEFSLPEDLWPVQVDEGQINQVINNLIINADQSMPEGGTINITAENLTISGKENISLREGKYVNLFIKDEGIGIPEEYLPKIFDPYFTTKKRGSGLGLAISYSIVKNHGGHITVHSQPGAGTTFSLYLPASQERIPKKDALEKNSIITGKGRILLMDDDKIIREAVGEMLDSIGYESDCAKDGAEAIELYKQSKESNNLYAAIILDLTVPGGMGGKEAVQKLCKIDPDIKAIVSSGYSHDPIMANFRQYGFSGVIAKPYKMQELSKIIHNVIMGI